MKMKDETRHLSNRVNIVLMSMAKSLGKFVLSMCLILSPHAAFAQTNPIPYHHEPYDLHSGMHDGFMADDYQAFRGVVESPGAPWLQLHFDEFNLGSASYITLTSLEDSGYQYFNTRSLTEYRGFTAFFNGDAVEVILHVATGERDIFFSIDEIIVGELLAPDKTLCDNDDRVSSTDPAIGRIMPGGCTAWIISNGAFLTAGHCNQGSEMQFVHFNVPQSECNGVINISDSEDQYFIAAGSITSVNNADGDDYAIFRCHSNSITHLHPTEAQGAFYRISRDEIPTDVSVTGYGYDDTPPGCTGGFNSDHRTQQTNSGSYLREVIQNPSEVYLEYFVDTEEGNSGSPIIVVGTQVAIGIHTTGGCNPPGAGNIGTSFENDNLENAIQTYFGSNVVYVDKDHPEIQEDGTIFRPFDTVNEGVNAATSGASISIVTGSYSETITISKQVTFTAPVGPVTIGP